jgi:hypothetical protein
MRWTGYQCGDHSTLSIIANLGKRSIAVDLKTETGHTIVKQLLANADIFLESFRPGVITRLGLGYEVVSALNPRIIYLSVSGFGQHGPLRERPGTAGRSRHSLERTWDFTREHPVFAAGAGLAFGAALAALLPISRTEQRRVGRISREARDASHPNKIMNRKMPVIPNER